MSEKPRISIVGQDGNTMAIMSAVHEVLKAQDRNDEWPAVQKRMMSGDYGNVLTVAEEFVEFE